MGKQKICLSGVYWEDGEVVVVVVVVVVVGLEVPVGGSGWGRKKTTKKKGNGLTCFICPCTRISVMMTKRDVN